MRGIAGTSAVQRSFNQEGPSIPTRVQKRVVQEAHSALSIHWSEREGRASCGTAQGSTEAASASPGQPARGPHEEAGQQQRRNNLRLTPTATENQGVTIRVSGRSRRKNTSGVQAGDWLPIRVP